jgi:hypothetical protein
LADELELSPFGLREENAMNQGKLHYGWIVIFMGMLTTIAAHGFGRMA